MAHSPLSPSPVPGPAALAPAPRSWRRHVALLVVFIAALVAWLAAGVGALLGLAMTPEPGYDAVVVALKGLLVAGWLGTLAWLGRDMGRGSFGMVAAPIGAWIWVYLVGALLGTVAYLNVGY